MAGEQTLTDLHIRKQALILESRVNRLLIETEWNNLKGATQWIRQAAQTCQTISPWISMAAPAAGILLAMGLRRRTGSLLGTLLSAMNGMASLYALWRKISQRDGATAAAPVSPPSSEPEIRESTRPGVAA